MFKPELDKGNDPDKVELGVAERGQTELSTPEFERKLAEVCLMEPAEYLRQRRAKAEELGIPCALLDDERKRRQKETESEAAVMQAHWNVEPWHEPVKAGEVYRRIKKRILRHVIIGDHAATASALWIMFAWVHDAAVHSPILLVSSPEAECGKSTLLGLVKYLTPRGINFVHTSGPVLFRMIEKWRPTLIVDEADSAFKDTPELRSVINAGWTRGTGVPRCHPETHEPEFFETFGPKAIGLKGLKIPDTTLSRSIVIEMQRKLPGDSVESFAHADDDELAELRRQLARFAMDSIDALRDWSPRMPDGFSNRLEANWKMLIAIAELCGVAAEAREGAETLSRRSDEASLGVELLRDIRDEVFAGTDRIRSQDLVNKLTAMEDRPWSDMPYTGKQITHAQVARLLKPYGVKPDQVRFGEQTFKGYRLEWFTDAFRYIPADPGENRGNTETNADFRHFRGNTGGNTPPNVSANVSAKMAENGQCFPVSPVLGDTRGAPSPEVLDTDPWAHLRDPRYGLQPLKEDFDE
jgi:putative DNA primase/helicase